MLARLVVGVAEQPELVTLRGEPAEQQFGGWTEQVIPAGVNAELHLVPTAGVIGDPAGSRHRFIAVGIDQ